MSLRSWGDVGFWAALVATVAAYLALILGMLAADSAYAPPGKLIATLAQPEIRAAIRLSLISCTITAVLSLLVAVPIGYLLSRARFPGRGLLDALFDIPIVLPPLVIGLSLLIMFRVRVPFTDLVLNDVLPLTYTVGGVVLAQFVVGSAFAIRTMRSTFDHLSARPEQVALTLGCSQFQAFHLIAMPLARRGMVTAATIAWARSLGEFGPILVFAGATRMRTEVLPTTVFLELSVGNLEAAVAVSLLMVVLAVGLLTVVRRWGDPR